MRQTLALLLGVSCLAAAAIAADPATTTYRGLTVQTVNPTGVAGLRIDTNFKTLADRIGPVNYVATTDPTVTDDVDEGYYLGSLWLNTVTPSLWWCASNADGAAVWIDLSAAGGAASISDTAYAESWNGVTTIGASKNALYDYLSGLSSVYQAADADLGTLAGLSSADSNIIVGSATGWVVESGATARTSLGVAIGTNVQAWDSKLTAVAETEASDGWMIYGAKDTWVSGSPATVRGVLDLEIGTDVQAYDADLADLADGTLTGSKLGTCANTTGALPTTNGVTDGYVPKKQNDGTVSWAADTDTNTTYTAGDGLDLTGTDFDLDLDSVGGLEIDGGGELTLTSTHLTGDIGITIDGAGAEIVDGLKGFVRVPFACTITGVYLMADQSGSIVVDVWKEPFADYPPADGNSITASAPPTLSTAASGSDTTLTGWTKTVAAGDVIGFNVDSCTTITRLTLQLTVTK